jgi:hypothetical protein
MSHSPDSKTSALGSIPEEEAFGDSENSDCASEDDATTVLPFKATLLAYLFEKKFLVSQ